MKKKSFLILLFLLIFISFKSVAQNSNSTKTFNLFQDTIKTICKKIYSSKEDIEKEKYNEQLLTTLERALNTANSFEFPFDSIKDIGVLMSPDKQFRIINWNVPKKDGTFKYYGFIQEKYEQIIKKGILKKTKTELIQLYPLMDKSSEIRNPDNTITDNKKWLGMLYYKIIIKKTKAKTYYTLLAWEGHDKLSTRKIIDVLTFDNNGTPRFGADIFNYQKKFPKRVIFEYSADCTMSLKYSTKKDSIVFDHLSPTSPQLEGQYQYYCNDMSYDGFGFKKGKWNYGIDLNVVNDRDEKDKNYNDPHFIVPTKESKTLKEDRKKKKKKEE